MDKGGIMNNNYTVLHLHSMDSNPKSGLTIDSVTPFQDYIIKAKECGMTALAFTEHGAVLHNVSKKQMCEKNGIKYIHGQEFYVTEEIDKNNLVRDNYHLIMLAKNKDGVKEINYLSSIANNREDGHYYYTPRIELSDVINTSDNILILTACCAGILCRGTSEAKEKFLTFIINNKHRCWFEIQPHKFDKQVQYNQYLYKISQEFGIKLVATSDVHAVSQDHLIGRTVMQKSKKIVFHDEDECDLCWHNYDEMVNAFRSQKSLPEEVYINAINETNNIANMIEDYKLDYSNKYPRRKNAEEEFKKRIDAGVKEHKLGELPNYETDYLPRIKEEFETYKHNDAIDFMLLDSDYKNWMRDNNMYYGPSRGSVSGSLIAWLIHSTDVDSVKYNLNFSRFMNPERQSLADVDTDIYAEDRYKVREYFFNRPDVYCCNIITFNTIKMRGAIKDVARAFEMTVDKAQEICNTVYEDENGNECVPDEVREKYPELFFYVDIVIGTIVSLGRHAAGIVVSPTDVKYEFGTLTIDADPRPVSQIDMHEIDSLNFVKMDLLGLNAVGLINKACDLAGIPNLTPEMVNFSDENIIKSISEDTTMIFQFESGFASESLKKTFSKETIAKIKKKNKDISYLDIMAMVSGAIRPAGESYREALFNGEYHDNGEKALNDFLAPTLGYCIEENQNVMTVDGEKSIKNIQVGDRVYTVNGISNVIQKNDMGCMETIEIVTGYRNLICTKDHKILTDYGWKEAGSLSAGDCIACRISTESHTEYSRDKLRFIGYLIGDGDLNNNNNIGFSNRDYDVACDFKRVSETFDNCTASIYNRGSRVNNLDLYYLNVKYINQRKSMTPAAEYLCSIGMKYYDGGGCTAKEKFVPSFIFGLNRECILEFLGAYADTDCHVNSNHIYICYKTSSIRLKDDIVRLISLVGYMANCIYDEKTNSYAITVSDAPNYINDLYDYSFRVRKNISDRRELLKHRAGASNLIHKSIVEDLIKSNGISLKQVQKKAGINLYYKKYISLESFKKISKVFNLTIEERFLNDNIRYVLVKNICDTGNRKVYDIGVENEHNFVCNGIIVHNCVYQEQIIEFLNKFCGFTMGQADIIRRGFAKKTGTEKYIPIIKDGGYMEDIHGDRDERYIPGYINIAQEKYGMTKERAKKSIEYFLRVIEDASSYLFSKNHSVPYSMIGLYIGYLRYYYPLQLLTAALNVYKANEPKMREIKAYVKSKGIEIRPIRFGKSRADYFMDVKENCIYNDIESIKECNAKSAEELYELSKNHYDNFIDLLFDIKEKTTLNKTQLNILTKLGFFNDFGDINQLLFITDEFDKYYNKKSIKKNSPMVMINILKQFSDSETPTHIDEINIDAFLKYRGIEPTEEELEDCHKYKYMVVTDEYLASIANTEEYCTIHNDQVTIPEIKLGEKIKIPNGYSFTKIFKKYKITEDEKKMFATKTVYGKFDGIHTRQLLKYLLENSQYPPCSVEQKIRYEQELLGYIDYKNPKLDKRYFIVTQLDTKYSPKFIAYCLNNGNSVEMRVKKRRNPKNKFDKTKVSFADKPFDNGDILYLKSWGKEPKMKKTDNGWEKDPSVMYIWMYDYDIVNEL